MLRIKLVRSLWGNNPRNRRTVAALGLRKMNQVVEHDDTPSIRGMVHHVKHLLHVEVIEGIPSKKKAVEEKPKAAPKPEAKPGSQAKGSRKT